MKYIDKLKTPKIGLLAILAIVLPFFVPEVREFLGLQEGGKDTIIVNVNPATAKPPQEQHAGGNDNGRKVSGKKNASGELAHYRGIVMDSIDRPVAGVRIVCATCEEQQMQTNEKGEFVLAKRYEENDVFRQESVTFSKDNKAITVSLNWREVTPIKF